MSEQESTSKGSELTSLLRMLTPRQLDFIRERLSSESDAEAARRCGIRTELPAKWKAAGAPLDAIVQLAKMDSIEVGQERLRRLVNPALDVLEDEMRDRRARHAAAVQILDRAGLVPCTKTVVSGDANNPITIMVEYANHPLATTDAPSGADSGPEGSV